MNKYYWIFGGIAGVVCSLLEFGFYSAFYAPEKFLIFWVAKIAVLALCLVYGVIAIKKYNGNKISFPRVLMSGVLIAAIRAVIMIAGFALMEASSPTFFDQARNDATEASIMQLEEKDKTPEYVDEVTENVHAKFTFGGYATDTLMSSVFTGLVLSMFTAAFVYTRDIDQQ